MGLSAATQLSAKGANVIIIARNQQKLDTALVEIKVGGREHLRPYQVHLHTLTQLFPDDSRQPSRRVSASMPSRLIFLNPTMHPP